MEFLGQQCYSASTNTCYSTMLVTVQKSRGFGGTQFALIIVVNIVLMYLWIYTYTLNPIYLYRSPLAIRGILLHCLYFSVQQSDSVSRLDCQMLGEKRNWQESKQYQCIGMIASLFILIINNQQARGEIKLRPLPHLTAVNSPTTGHHARSSLVLLYIPFLLSLLSPFRCLNLFNLPNLHLGWLPPALVQILVSLAAGLWLFTVERSTLEHVLKRSFLFSATPCNQQQKEFRYLLHHMQ